MEVFTLQTTNEEETIQAGEQFASQLSIGDVVALDGELGAGKTEFVKGVCRFFNVEDLVTSPTFSIINQYQGTDGDGDDLVIYHVDLYRVETSEQLTNIGFDDMVFAHNAIKLVEWSSKAQNLLPNHHWNVVITAPDDVSDLRVITINQLQKEQV
jgi:tRNA threonylcarbamoyladenosine biosynthesis protein TsaE